MSIPVGWASQRLQQFSHELSAQMGVSAPGAAPTGAATETRSSFGSTLEQALGEINGAQDNAAAYTSAYLRGEPVELHQVMAATEEAGIALEMLVQVRNKVTDAYRSLINMQS